MMLVTALLLMFLSASGLAYVAIRALQSGARNYSGVYAQETASAFEDLFLFIPARRVAELGWGLSGAVFLLVFLVAGGLQSTDKAMQAAVAGAVFALPVLRVPRLLLHILKARRLKKFNIQLVEALGAMSNSLKAGFSIMQSFETIARDGENPIAQEFGALLQQTRVGVNFSDALENLQERVGSDDLTLVCLAVETARQTGGNLTGIFEQIATTIRERFRIENRIQTLTAQGKLQGIVVSAMPLIIGVALLIIDPGMMIPFLRSMMGLAIMVIVAVLLTCGGLLIRKIVRIDV
jgi:tight adherence protein B